MQGEPRRPHGRTAGPSARGAIGGRVPQGKSKSNKRRLIGFLVIFAMLASAAFFGGPPAYREMFVAPIEKPTDPTFSNDDGKVMLKVPTMGMEKGTKVSFDYRPERAASMNNGQLPLKAISQPVDVTPERGALKPDRVAVTLEYDPSLIPEGLTADQVGMAVFDENLDTWVPILNAKADAETNTVTAIAPHFSEFLAFVLEPLEQAFKIGSMAVETAINASISVQSWFNGLVNELAGNLVKDLFGQVDPLNCDPASTRVKGTATSSFDLLKVCTKPANDNDRLHISNGFAFPLLTSELPTGIKLEQDDLGNNGDDTAAMIRSVYWASKNKAYISGASHTSVTVTGEMQKNATIEMELDDEAIAFDIALAALTVLAPPSAAAKSGIKLGLDAALKGQDIAGIVGDGAAWFQSVNNTLDCIANASQGSFEAKLGMEPVDQMFTDEGYEDAADLAHGCLGKILEQLNLKGALAELLSSIKVIPEVLSSAAYVTAGALLESLPTQFDNIKQQPVTATVTRVEAAPEQPEPSPSQAKPETPPVSLKDVERFAGTWRQANGSLTVNKDGTGQFTVNGFCLPDDPGLADFQACTVQIPVQYEDTGTGAIYGYFGEPVARSARDGQNNKIVQMAPADLAKYSSKRFELSQSTDEHIVGVTPEGSNPIWLCDDYAHRAAQDARTTGGRYREQCNKPL